MGHRDGDLASPSHTAARSAFKDNRLMLKTLFSPCAKEGVEKSLNRYLPPSPSKFNFRELWFSAWIFGV